MRKTDNGKEIFTGDLIFEVEVIRYEDVSAVYLIGAAQLKSSERSLEFFKREKIFEIKFNSSADENARESGNEFT